MCGAVDGRWSVQRDGSDRWHSFEQTMPLSDWFACVFKHLHPVVVTDPQDLLTYRTRPHHLAVIVPIKNKTKVR